MRLKYERYINERKKNWKWSTFAFRYMDKEIGLNGKRILDIGCGFGWHAKMFNDYGADVTGLDFSKEKLEIFEKLTVGRENITWVYGSAFNIPLKSNFFDVVFMNQTIHHLIDPDLALREAHRVLKENGLIFISDSNRLNLYYTQHRFRKRIGTDKEFRHHYYMNFFTHYEITKILQKNGFKDVKICCPGDNFNKIYSIINVPILKTLYNIFFTPSYLAHAKKSVR